MSQRLFNNTVFNVGQIVVNVAMVFVLTPLLVRGLGREGYGLWVLGAAFSATGYFNLLEFGLQSAVVKYVAEYQVQEDDERMNRMVGASLAFHLVFGVIACLAIWLIASNFLITWFSVSASQAAVLKPLLWIFGGQTLVEFPMLTVAGVLEGVQAIATVRAVEMLRAVSFGVGSFILLSLGHGVLAIGGLSAGLSLICLIAMILAVRRLAPRVKPRLGFEGEATKIMLRFSGKIFANRILATIYYQMDKTIIVVLLPVLFLTDYDVVMKLYGAAITVAGIISRNVVPLASALHADGQHVELARIVGSTMRYEAILSLPVVITLAVLAGPFIHHWLGPGYVHDASLVRLILLEAAVVPLVGAGYNALIGMNRVTPLVLTLALGTTINLAISIALARRLGVAGVLWGTVVAHLLIVYPVYLKLMKGALPFSWRAMLGPTLGRIYPLAAVFGVVAAVTARWLAPSSMISVLAVGAGLGCMGLLWLGLTGLTSTERQQFIRAVRAFELRSALGSSTALK
jgi:O-antigen/teichoic acid export membrane protein